MISTAKLFLNSKVPQAGALSRNMKDVQIPAVDNPDGTISGIAQFVIPVDPNSDPITYTMPCSQLVSKGGVLEDTRTMNAMRVVGPIAAVGNTIVWTPSAATLRFRVIRFQIVVLSGSTAAAANSVTLQDGAGAVVYSSGVAAGALAALPAPLVLADVMLPGNGYLSATAGNVLNCAIGGSAFTAGGVYVNVWGCEE